MANLLTITKKPHGFYDFVVNEKLTDIVTNDMNRFMGVGDLCHFKTVSGANVIKEQNIAFGNITLIDGSPLATALSIDDLINKLESIGFFDWRDISSGSGGVNRYEELIDTEPFFGNDGKVPIVDEAEMKLKYTTIPDTSKLDQFPANGILGKMLIGNASGGYDLIDPPAGANGYVQAFTYASPDTQEFTLATTASLISVVINGGLADPDDWTQIGNLLTILPTYTLNNDDRIIVTGVI